MTDKQENIHIIATGGTIDSKFFAPKEGSKVKDKSGIPDFLKNIINNHFDFTFDQFVMLDSSDITDDIRAALAQKIQETNSNKVLITHGTNTMSETLEYLDKRLFGTKKTIILTGAMIPMDGFCPTDGGFNLGYAIGQLQNLPSGVYIAMHGNIFKAGEAEKNFQIARFEYKKAS
ncbi:MAG: asparaginase domain-containing protein [Alphaproteobacteria bacterium]|nr:asparaginase domain-containing protein [Alphaproteobacteria bacterium]